MGGAAATRCAFILLLIIGVAGDNCRIRWIEKGHPVSDSKFQVTLSIADLEGDENTYFPDTKYDVRISSVTKETFAKFYFTMFNVNATKNYGFLELRDKDLSMFHNGPYCFNRIVDGPNSLEKRNITIAWHSPPVNSGCINFKAIVRETDERYHVANKTVCQDKRVELDDPGPINRNCCACDEGKYELAFEGLWSRYHHPKHFPRQEWLATFPTLIGVSHSIFYEFWKPFTYATEGLKRFAEYGYAKELEREIKSNASFIRTLMKFQGSNFQNETQKSFSMFRVNKYHHVISLVARMDPSPDWFLGVNSLELCMPDCTWLQRKTLNLYAYDVGVREGILYEPRPGEKPDELTTPPDIIQRLNMTWPIPRPDGEEGPFYDKTNNTHEIRPLARIHLRRLVGSERKCEKDEVTESDACATEWSDWSPCEADCSVGVSRRNRTKRPDYPNCFVKLEETKVCSGKSEKCEAPLTDDDCRLSEWSQWKKCTKDCGQEATERNRHYLWPEKQERCIATRPPQLMREIADCGNPPCPNDQPLCHDDRYLSWSNYSTCQAVVDANGDRSYVKFRYRQLNKNYVQKPGESGLNAKIDGGYSGCLYEEVSCEPLSLDTSVTSAELPELPQKPVEPIPPIPPSETGDQEPEDKEPEIPEKCTLPMDKGTCLDGQTSVSHRYYYDSEREQCLLFAFSGCGGNENNFKDQKTCNDSCIILGRPIDCVMHEEFSAWTECKYCDQVSMRTLEVKIRPKNGGRPCPLSKAQYRNCNTVLDKCKPKKKVDSTKADSTKELNDS